jgi:hypothetical protein
MFRKNLPPAALEAQRPQSRPAADCFLLAAGKGGKQNILPYMIFQDALILKYALHENLRK